MRLLNIMPTAYLQPFQDVFGLHDKLGGFALSHLLKRDAEYRAFYIKHPPVMLDNGAWELGWPDREGIRQELVDCVDLCSPRTVAAPDRKVWPVDRNIEEAKRLRDALREREVKVAATPHCKDRSELEKAVEEIEYEGFVLALPFVMIQRVSRSYQAPPLGLEETRAFIIASLISSGFDPSIHCFGMKDPHGAFQSARQSESLSIDAADLFCNAHFREHWSSPSSNRPPRPRDYFNLPFNRRVFQRFCCHVVEFLEAWAASR